MEEGRASKDERVKDVHGQILWEGVEVRRRWAEYFEQVLNVEDIRDANINVDGDKMSMLGEMNERVISFEEGREALKEMKLGKAAGQD